MLQDYNSFIEFLSSKLNSSGLFINQKVEKLLSIYNELVARSHLAFSGLSSPNDHRERESFNKQIASNLTELIGSKEDSFLWRNKYYLLSSVFELSALGLFLFPPCEILFTLEMPYIALILAGLGLIIAISSCIYEFFQLDPLEEKYSILSKI